MAITRRQKEVMDFLSAFTQKNGYSPSYEEIAAGLGVNSLATVHKHVTNLQNKGLLQRAHNRSRSIDVLPVRAGKKGSDRVPLMGRIAAGRPVEAIETAESISLGEIIGNREVFALEVQGDSMRDEHIVSGDYVLVETNAHCAGRRDHRCSDRRLGGDLEALLSRRKCDSAAALERGDVPYLCAGRERQYPRQGAWRPAEICLKGNKRSLWLSGTKGVV